jgi:hypothetical protein
MRIKKVEYVDGYKLKLLFSDKKSKIVDIEPIIKKSKGLFHPLKDIEYFKKVSLDDVQYPLSICWPNGADICPDVLYEMGKDVQEKKKQPKLPARRIKHQTTFAMSKKRPKDKE